MTALNDLPAVSRTEKVTPEDRRAAWEVVLTPVELLSSMDRPSDCGEDMRLEKLATDTSGSSKTSHEKASKPL